MRGCFVHILFIVILNYVYLTHIVLKFLNIILNSSNNKYAFNSIKNFFIIYAEELSFLGILPFKGKLFSSI